jgi:hypothetical protein
MAASITVTVDAVNYVFALDSNEKDSCRYLDPSNTLALPRTLLARRVYPKRQKTFPGVARNSLKMSRMFSYGDGTTSPIIMETTVSRRADTLDADLQLTRKLHAQLILDSEFDGFFTSLSL